MPKRVTKYHKTLDRQIRKLLPSLGDCNSKELRDFLDNINAYYINTEEERLLNKHIFDVASKEYELINQKLKKEKYIAKEALRNLVSALENSQTEDKEGPSEQADDLLQLSILIQKEIELRKRTEKQLLQAKNAANKANQSKTKFISHLSHEIRNPLNVIIGVSDLLKENEHLDAQIDYLNALQVNSRTLGALINDVLDFTKIEAGKIELNQEPFSIQETLNNLHTSFSLVAKQKKLKLNTHVDAKIDGQVLGDKMRITQVLNNLTSNALKFTSKGQVDITATFIEETENSATIQFKVKDTGIGLSKESIAHIFDEYKQAESITYKKYGGSGLGLSISTKLLKKMGSKLEVESVFGEGSTFSFKITLPKSAKTIQKIAPKFYVNKEYTKGKKALVVDDSAFNYMVAENVLKTIGIVSTHALSGEECIQLLKSQMYDLILMDVHMGGMNGYETIEVIREKDQEIPIYILTGSVTAEPSAHEKGLAINGVFTKPINPQHIAQNLQQLFADKK